MFTSVCVCGLCIVWSHLKIMHFLLKRANVVVVAVVVCPVCVISLDIQSVVVFKLVK